MGDSGCSSWCSEPIARFRFETARCKRCVTWTWATTTSATFKIWSKQRGDWPYVHLMANFHMSRFTWVSCLCQNNVKIPQFQKHLWRGLLSSAQFGTPKPSNCFRKGLDRSQWSEKSCTTWVITKTIAQRSDQKTCFVAEIALLGHESRPASAVPRGRSVHQGVSKCWWLRWGWS